MAVRQLRSRDDYFVPPDAGATPGPHTHPPADIVPQGAGSTLNADLLDGLDSTAFAPAVHAHAHGALTGIGPNDHHAQVHALVGSDHTASGLTAGHVLTALNATTFAFQPPTGGGGGDADTLDGLDSTAFQLATQPALIRVRKDSGVNVGTRHRLNLIQGTGISLAVADDAGDDEVDITVSATGAAAAQTHTHVDHEVPTFVSGVTYTLATMPITASERLVWNGIQLRRVASGPLVGEYSISGLNITLGAALGVGDRLWAHYDVAGANTHAHTDHDVPANTGVNTWTLVATPLVGSEQVFVNGVELRRVPTAPLVGEYRITGAVVTLGWTLGGTDKIWAHYRT